MAWIYLTVAGVLEIGWAIGLKYTEGFTPPAAVAVDHRQHDSEHRPARAGAQDAAGRDRLRGMDRNRCGRNRGARHLSVRGTRDRVAADIHRLDPVRYRRPQAGHVDCWTPTASQGSEPSSACVPP